MKKICLNILLLLVLLFCPVMTSYASSSDDEIEVYDSTNFTNFNDGNIIPGNEPLEFDEKGRITKGVVYYSYYVPYGLDFICWRRLELTATPGNCLYIASSNTWDVRASNDDNTLSYTQLQVTKSDKSTSNSPDRFVFPFNDSYSGASKEEYNSVSCANMLNVSQSNFYSFWTNIPIFQCNYTQPSDALKNYLENGDYSGANNAPDVDNAKDATAPKNKYENKKGPWLKMGNFDGSNLTIRPAIDSYCTWYYAPQNTDDFTDLTLDVMYDYQLSYQLGPTAVLGNTLTYHREGSVPLSDFQFSYGCRPCSVAVDSGWCKELQAVALMYGGSFTESIGLSWIASGSFGTEVAKVTGSFFTVTFRLKGKRNGDWVNGPVYIEKVDLLERTCTEVAGYADDEGNYTPDTNGKVTDENGNVEVKNDIDINAPGGGGGGGSSSATGGSVGNITNTNTFKFPDHLTVDLNINGGGSGGGSSGSSSSSDSGKKWYDRLLDAFGSLLDFLTGVVTKLFEALGDLLTTFADSVGDFIQYLFEGFGLFKNDGGIGSLIQENYSFVPPEVWRLVMFGIASVILVSIVNRFFK